MELIRYSTEVIAKFIDETGIHKIGLGLDSLNKTDAELEALALTKYNEIKYLEQNPPAPSYQVLREKEYLSQGITEKEMIVALWEKVIENRPQAANDLQAKREQIKTKYPKT